MYYVAIPSFVQKFLYVLCLELLRKTAVIPSSRPSLDAFQARIDGFLSQFVLHLCSRLYKDEDVEGSTATAALFVAQELVVPRR